MADVTIDLEGGKRPVHPGDLLSGAVTLATDGNVRCDGLNLSWGWETSGKGIDRSVTLVEETLFEGEIADPGPRRYPFEVEVPENGPFTYRGRLLELEWYLRVRADIPWARDPKAEERIEVAVPPAPEDEPGSGDEPWDDELPESPPGLWAPVIGGIACVLSLIVGGIGLAVGIAQGELPIAGLGSAFLLAALLVAFHVVRPVIAGRRVGATRITVSPERVWPGRSLRCRVVLVPPRNLELEGVTATIFAREEVVTRRSRRMIDEPSTRRRTKSRTVFEEEIEVSGPRTAVAGEPFRAEAEIPIPPDAPPSFRSRFAEIEWRVDVRVRIPWWTDLVSTHEVEVGP